MKALLIVLAVFLVGCVEVTKPETPEEAIAFAAADIEAAAQTIESNRQQGYLTETQAADAKKALQGAVTDLRLAKDALALGNDTEVRTRTEAVARVILAVRRQFYPPPAGELQGATP